MDGNETRVWPFEAGGYELLGVIGRGAFSKVCRARCKPSGAFVAIKVMELEHITTSFEDILQVGKLPSIHSWMIHR